MLLEHSFYYSPAVMFSHSLARNRFLCERTKRADFLTQLKSGFFFAQIELQTLEFVIQQWGFAYIPYGYLQAELLIGLSWFQLAGSDRREIWCLLTQKIYISKIALWIQKIKASILTSQISFSWA